MKLNSQRFLLPFILYYIWKKLKCRVVFLIIFYNLVFKLANAANCVTMYPPCWSCSLTCLPLFYSCPELALAATSPSSLLECKRIWAYSSALAADPSSSPLLIGPSVLVGCCVSKSLLVLWVEVSWAGVSCSVVGLSGLSASPFEEIVWRETQRSNSVNRARGSFVTLLTYIRQQLTSLAAEMCDESTSLFTEPFLLLKNKKNCFKEQWGILQMKYAIF